MSLWENLISQGTIERLGWMLVHFLWQATVVALLLAVLLRVLRRADANLRYAAACGALALMAVLPLITMQLVEIPGPAAEAGPLREIAPPTAEPLPLSVERVGQLPPLSAVPPLETADVTVPIPWQERAATALEPALPYMVLGWLAGVFGLSAWHLGGWAQLQRLKRRMTRKAGPALHTMLDALANGLGVRRAVILLESALVEVPTVIGWLRPAILLPASAMTGLSPDQLRAILAHELAHIRRHDYLANIVQTVLEILGFYHPAVWWVSNRIRIERENCCDDLAVHICGNSLQYARALTSMEEIRHRRSDLAVAATGGSLMARIARLLGRPAADDRRFAWLPGLITLLLVASIVIPAALVFATPVPAESDPALPEAPIQDLAGAEPNNPLTADESARPQVLLAFTIIDVFADRVLDRDTAVRARDLLTLIRPSDANWPITSTKQPTLDELRSPLREVFARFEPIHLKSKELTDLLVSRGYAEVLSTPSLLTAADTPASIMIGQKKDPNAPDSQSVGGYLEMTVVPHLLEEINATRLQIDYKDQGATGDPDDPNRLISTRQIASTLVIPNDQHIAIVARSTRDPHTSLRLLLIGPIDAIKLPRTTTTGANATVESPLPSNTEQQDETQILINFKILKALTDVVVDRETMLLAGALLAAENPPALDEIANADPRQSVTLGEFLRTWVAGRHLEPLNMEILLDVLQSRGYLGGEATPEVQIRNHKRARMNMGAEKLFLPSADPASPPTLIPLGTIVQMTPHVASPASDRITLEIAIEWRERITQDDANNAPTVRSTAMETTVTTPRNRYFTLMVEPDSIRNAGAADSESLLVMFRAEVLETAAQQESPSVPRSPSSDADLRQVLLDTHVVAIEPGDLRNLGVEWAYPAVRSEQITDGDDWLTALTIGYSPDSAFTKVLMSRLNQLEATNQARIVAHPRLIALDGHQARLRSVQEEWFLVGGLMAGNPSKVQRTESGTILSITPRIGDKDQITLEIETEASNTHHPRGPGSDLPIVTRRRAKNAVTVRNGGTVAIGGLHGNPIGQNDRSAKNFAVFVTATLVSETDGVPQSGRTVPALTPPEKIEPKKPPGLGTSANHISSQ